MADGTRGGVGAGRKSTGDTHLSRDSRVQITPKLLEVRVRWVFYLESLLWTTFGRRKKENLKQCEKCVNLLHNVKL